MLSLGFLLSHEPVFARGGGLDAIASAANLGQGNAEQSKQPFKPFSLFEKEKKVKGLW